MFDDKIGKILGSNPQGLKNPLQTPRSNFNVNPTDVVQKIRQVLDRCPEVKKAQGNIVIELADGRKTTVNLQYRS